jgi:hypothetical protein
MTKSVVELNGKKYDAVTGKELAPATPKTSQPTVSHVKHKGTNMDGFVRAPQAQTIHPATAHHPKPKATAPKNNTVHTMQLVNHRVPRHLCGMLLLSHTKYPPS